MEDVKAHLKEYTSGKIYLHTMRKVMKEGKAFLREERARRMKMIQEMGVFSKKWGIGNGASVGTPCRRRT